MGKSVKFPSVVEIVQKAIEETDVISYGLNLGHADIPPEIQKKLKKFIYPDMANRKGGRHRLVACCNRPWSMELMLIAASNGKRSVMSLFQNGWYGVYVGQ